MNFRAAIILVALITGLIHPGAASAISSGSAATIKADCTLPGSELGVRGCVYIYLAPGCSCDDIVVIDGRITAPDGCFETWARGPFPCGSDNFQSRDPLLGMGLE